VPEAAAQGSPWASVEVTFSDAQIVVEKVSYRGPSPGAPRVFGQVCRPAAPGRYPLLVVNHGGWEGLGGDWEASSGCRSVARNGYVEIESAYRGEDGSEGKVELCLGEVDDVLDMLAIARAQPYVDPSRVAMSGASHGACIALRAVQRGAPVNVAIDFAGPTDWAALYRFWVEQKPKVPAENAAIYQKLIDQTLLSTGGTPDEKPEEYRKRSPLAFTADLVASQTAVFILHGGDDAIVMPSQSCRLVAAASAFRSYRLDGAQKETATAPAYCADGGITWLAEARPTTTWPENRYLVLYDGVGHGFAQTPASAAAFGDFLGIVLARLPAR